MEIKRERMCFGKYMEGGSVKTSLRHSKI